MHSQHERRNKMNSEEDKRDKNFETARITLLAVGDSLESERFQKLRKAVMEDKIGIDDYNEAVALGDTLREEDAINFESKKKSLNLRDEGQHLDFARLLGTYQKSKKK